MSFADQLRAARSSPTSILHKFLSSYNPSGVGRIHAFVEGEPDQAFYRSQIERHCRVLPEVILYNCEGKKNVFAAHNDVISRFPDCKTVLFFVDRDLDDLVGVAWPCAPRIFVTEWYSVEHYVVSGESVLAYFQEFCKVRGAEIDLAKLSEQFQVQLLVFYRLILPVMAWVIAAKRTGLKPVVQNISMADLVSLDSECATRRRFCQRLSLLNNVTGLNGETVTWKDVRSAVRDIKNVDPRQFVRGKFAGWLFIAFLNKASALLSSIVREAGGSMSTRVQIQESNFIQLLSPKIQPSLPLKKFLALHLGE
jgi:hypothetical protein